MATNNQYTTWYDPNDVHIFIDKEEVGAFSDNNMVAITWRNDRQSLVVDPKGVGSMVRNNDRSGTITLLWQKHLSGMLS